MSEPLRIHLLQHVSYEGSGSIHDWIVRQGHRLGVTRLFAGDPLPDLDEIEWLIVVGGSMGVYDHDRYPWLAAEHAFVRGCIERDKTVLGICLGAQLIARALGADVTPCCEKEIGWFPVKRVQAAGDVLPEVMPTEVEVFHWHGDTFALPEGACHLYESEACANQAFLYRDRVLALQFHLEMTPESCEVLIEHGASDLVVGPFVQDVREMTLESGRFAAANMMMNRIMDQLAHVTRAS